MYELQVVSLLAGGDPLSPPLMNIRDIQSSNKESGVDMAFDALMDLEENSDLSQFMKTHLISSSGNMEELWTVENKRIRTSTETERVLRSEELYQVKQKQTDSK